MFLLFSNIKKNTQLYEIFFICCIVPSGILAIRTYIEPADAREVAENSTYPLCTHVESDVLVLGLAKRILVIRINFSFLKMIISIFKCFKNRDVPDIRPFSISGIRPDSKFDIRPAGYPVGRILRAGYTGYIEYSIQLTSFC